MTAVVVDLMIAEEPIAGYLIVCLKSWMRAPIACQGVHVHLSFESLYLLLTNDFVLIFVLVEKTVEYVCFVYVLLLN